MSVVEPEFGLPVLLARLAKESGGSLGYKDIPAPGTKENSCWRAYYGGSNCGGQGALWRWCRA